MSDRLREITLETQRDIFRLVDRDHGLTRKAISGKSGLDYDTVGTYARGEAVMPITALQRLCDVIPDYLLSRLLDPVGRHIGVNEGGDGGIDELGREAAAFTHEYVDAKADGKITPIEKLKLQGRAVRIADAAQKASAA